MGYAIPISRVQDIIENLMNETTKVKVDESNQGAIGVSCRDISSDIAQAIRFLRAFTSEVSLPTARPQRQVSQQAAY